MASLSHLRMDDNNNNNARSKRVTKRYLSIITLVCLIMSVLVVCSCLNRRLPLCFRSIEGHFMDEH